MPLELSTDKLVDGRPLSTWSSSVQRRLPSSRGCAAFLNPASHKTQWSKPTGAYPATTDKHLPHPA